MKPENHRDVAEVRGPSAAGGGMFLVRWRRAVVALCVLMWIGAFTATHVPGNDIPNELASLGDAMLHGAGFLGLSSWFILALAAMGVRPPRRAAIALGVMMLYGAVDERTQPYFGRACELRDWITDSVAAAAAVVLWELVFLAARRIARRRENASEGTSPNREG